VETATGGTNIGSYTGGGIDAPTALAVDGTGSLWVVNGNNTVSLFNNSGTALSPSGGYTGGTTGGISTPTGIAIDSSGAVWISNGGTSGSVTQVLGGAAPVITPTITATQTNSLGVKP